MTMLVNQKPLGMSFLIAGFGFLTHKMRWNWSTLSSILPALPGLGESVGIGGIPPIDEFHVINEHRFKIWSLSLALLHFSLQISQEMLVDYKIGLVAKKNIFFDVLY